MTKTPARDEVLYVRAAGVDVGKRFVMACVRTPHPRRAGRWLIETERFDTTAAAVRTLRDWLAERQVEVIALEATSDYWRAVCRHFLDQIDHLAALIIELDTRIAGLLRDHDEDLTNLDSIPGIGHTTAEIIIAETGGDMAPFVTAGHLASWIGVCPGLNESAGVTKSGHTRHGNAALKRVLGTAAIKRKDSYYTVYYRRLAARRGRQRALVAVMHKLVIAIWHVLHDRIAYHDLGADHFTRRDPQHTMRQIIKQANAIGLTVRFDPIPG